MCLLISVLKTCLLQLGHVAFFSSPKCSILMCLLQLDWLVKVLPQEAQLKLLSSSLWQRLDAASRSATARQGLGRLEVRNLCPEQAFYLLPEHTRDGFNV